MTVNLANNICSDPPLLTSISASISAAIPRYCHQYQQQSPAIAINISSDPPLLSTWIHLGLACELNWILCDTGHYSSAHRHHPMRHWTLLQCAPSPPHVTLDITPVRTVTTRCNTRHYSSAHRQLTNGCLRDEGAKTLSYESPSPRVNSYMGY